MNDQFYLQFANNGIKSSVAIYFPVEVLRGSQDYNFNDLPRHKWESLARYISTWIDMNLLASSGIFYNQSFGVSLCKAIARSMIV